MTGKNALDLPDPDREVIASWPDGVNWSISILTVTDLAAKLGQTPKKQKTHDKGPVENSELEKDIKTGNRVTKEHKGVKYRIDIKKDKTMLAVLSINGKQRCQCTPAQCHGNLEYVGLEVLKQVLAQVVELEDPVSITKNDIYQMRDDLLQAFLAGWIVNKTTVKITQGETA